MVRTPKGGVLPVSEVGKGLQTPEGARRRKEGEEAIPLCHFSTWDQAKPMGSSSGSSTPLSAHLGGSSHMPDALLLGVAILATLPVCSD